MGRSVRVETTVDWSLELISVSKTEPIIADVMLHPVSGGIAVTGSVDFVTDDICSKCLRSLSTERTATIGALFDGTPDDETYDLDGHDIEPDGQLVATVSGEPGAGYGLDFAALATMHRRFGAPEALSRAGPRTTPWTPSPRFPSSRCALLSWRKRRRKLNR